MNAPFEPGLAGNADDVRAILAILVSSASLSRARCADRRGRAQRGSA